MKGGGACALIW